MHAPTVFSSASRAAAVRPEQPPAGAALDFAPIFVVGMPRSGTTWVQRILTSHPEAKALVETYLLSATTGLGALLRTVNGEAPDREGPDGLGRLFGRSEMVAEVRGIAARWMREAAGPKARFIVEKSPWHLTDWKLIAEVLPEVRLVHVLRDGRDVAISLDAAQRSWALSPDPSIGRFAALWRDACAESRRARSELGERFLEIRFEQIKAHPYAAYAELFEFCGMPYDEGLLARVFERTDFERNHPGGEDRFYRGGRVGDWRTSLGLRNRLAFNRVAGRELLESGYESDRLWWLRGSADATPSDSRLAAIVAEANRIAALELPYFWGGGHLTPAPNEGPFDCSSAVCRVLQAAGYGLRTTWSGGLMRWGAPGPGQVTICANPGHAFLVIDGRFWGTSDGNPGGGPGWHGPRSSAGYVLRHPPDLPLRP
jgi:sulfotransferase family protein